jgi:hypothetical protein
MKNIWSKVTVSSGAPEMAALESILITFTAAYSAAGSPPGMAVYVTRTSDPTSDLYFSPAAWTFGQSLGATACEPPERDGLIIVACDERRVLDNFS